MKLNVAVIFGGRSVEHEISVLSAAQAIKAIDPEQYQVIPIYINKTGVWYTGEPLLQVENFSDLDQLLAKCQKIEVSQNAGEGKIYKSDAGIWGRKPLVTIDVVFPVLHGTNGEDGVLQGFLELMNIPYVGCDVLASAITMDKIVTKIMLQGFGIPVLDFIWFDSYQWIADHDGILNKVKEKFVYPLIVKPGNLGSSIGVTSVNTDSELVDAIDLAVSLSQKVLIEPKVVNLKEVNCAVLGDRESTMVSVCEEPISSEAILSYKDKYLSGSKSKKSSGIDSQGMSNAKRKIPADISEEMSKQIQDLAQRAFVNCNCCGVARCDFLIDQTANKVYCCELNVIPGSLSFYLWEPAGISFTHLTNRLIELALKRHRENNNLVRSYNTNILKNWSGNLGSK